MNNTDLICPIWSERMVEDDDDDDSLLKLDVSIRTTHRPVYGSHTTSNTCIINKFICLSQPQQQQ